MGDVVRTEDEPTNGSYVYASDLINVNTRRDRDLTSQNSHASRQIRIHTMRNGVVACSRRRRRRRSRLG